MHRLLRHFSSTLAALCFFIVISSAQTNISGVINTYAKVTSVDFCNNRVVLESATGFSPGKKALLIQMKGASIDASNTATYGNISAYNTTGNYEILTIQSISFNIVTFTETMIRQYDAVGGKVQLVEIPEYVDVNVVGNVTATPWDGDKGGVIALISTGTLSLSADIDATAAGFRGGAASAHTPCLAGASGYDGYVSVAADQWGAAKGEGISLQGDGFYARGAPANGGGGGNDRQTGGGGGSNFGTGGQGGEVVNPPVGTCSGIYQGIGGYLLSYSAASGQIFMGGGGGAGDASIGGATSGGNGGGLVLIRANDIQGNGFSIKSDGETVAATAMDDGAGGGGGAGTILIEEVNVLSTLNIDLSGGNGGNVDNTFDGVNCVGPGGGGAGGTLWMSAAALPANVVLNAAGGTSGITTGEAAVSPCFNSVNSATAGNPGGFIPDLSVPASLVIYIPLTLDATPDDANVCQGNTLFMSAIADGTGPLTFLWNDENATTTQDVTVTCEEDFIYSVTVTDARGCQLYATVPVNVIDSVVITASPDTTLVLGETISLTTNLDDTYTYLWNPTNDLAPDPTSANVEVDPSVTTTYCVTATETLTGCPSWDCVTIAVFADIAFPNAFSPNGDGINDIFRIPNAFLCDNVTYFKIFDRWGQLVYDYFNSADSQGWDGTNGNGVAFPIGNYIYLVKMTCEGEDRVFSSDVLLIR